nr:hypothetical protein [Tanacetum cinerariifolium]
METKDTLPSCSNLKAQQMQQIQDKAKKSCMVSFRQLHSHLKRLSQNDLQGSRTESGFKHVFATLSGQDTETFTGTMFLNVEQLEKQLDKEDFQEIGSMAAFNYTQQSIPEFRDTLIQYFKSVKKSINERIQLKREYDSWVNERQMQTTEEKVDTSKALDASSVDTESSRTESKEQDTSSRSGNDAHDDDVDIIPIYDEEPMVEVQTTAEIDVFAIGQQHTEQPEFNNEGEVAHNAEECHDTWKPMSQPLRNQSVVRQPTAFKSERPRISKPRCDSQVDVHNDLSKPVTTHYLPKEREAASAKPQHMIASSNSRISSKNMTRFSSNDMAHNHYLEEAKKKTQERSRSSEPSLMHSARLQSTANGSKPMHRRNTQTSRNWPASKNSFVNLRTNVISNKTTNINKPVERIGVPKEQERQILTGHRFSIQKTSVVQKKTMTPRSCLRWKPTGKIFKTVGLRWVPTGKIFAFSTTKVDSEPLNGSNANITNQYECEQTLDVSAGTLNLSADYDNPDPVPQRQDVSSSADVHVPSQQELDLLFGPLYDEFFNAGSNPQDKQPSTNTQSTSAPSTLINVHAEENNDHQAEEGEHLQDDEFTNPFCAPVQEEDESSSHNIDPKMCMFALTVKTAEPKNIKEAMADSAWIEVMQEELYQFDRLQVWELVDKPFGKTVIRLKWLWKNKKDEDQTVIHNKARLVAKRRFMLHNRMGLLTLIIQKGLPTQESSLWIEASSKGMIHQSPRGIFINQAKYALEIIHKHGMDKGQSIGTPMATKPKLDAELSGNPVDQTDYHSKIRSLMYLTSSRPDIVHAGSSFGLTAFSDADHAGCIDSRKSTSGGIQFLADKLVNWMSKKHNCAAMSSVEAEYVTLSASCAQVMWMRTQPQDYGFNYNKIPTEYKLANMFTKALPEDRFKYLVRRFGMRCLTPAELEVLAKESA